MKCEIHHGWWCASEFLSDGKYGVSFLALNKSHALLMCKQQGYEFEGELHVSVEGDPFGNFDPAQIFTEH